jgi:hypothetical protein
MLKLLQNCKIEVVSIRYDGKSHWVQAPDCYDPASFSGSEFRRLFVYPATVHHLFIPLIESCGFLFLLHEAQALNDVIDSLHALARFDCQPKDQIAIDVLNHLESINELPGTHYTASLRMCIILVHFVRRMSALKSSDAPHARAYPLVIEATSKLDTARWQYKKRGISDRCPEASQAIRICLLRSTSDLLEIADVLILSGRSEERARCTIDRSENRALARTNGGTCSNLRDSSRSCGIRCNPWLLRRQRRIESSEI